MNNEHRFNLMNDYNGKYRQIERTTNDVKKICSHHTLIAENKGNEGKNLIRYQVETHEVKYFKFISLALQLKLTITDFIWRSTLTNFFLEKSVYIRTGSPRFQCFKNNTEQISITHFIMLQIDYKQN